MHAKQAAELWHGQDTLSAGQQGPHAQNAQLVLCERSLRDQWAPFDIYSLNHAGLAPINSNLGLPSDANIAKCTRCLRLFHCSCFKHLDIGKSET